MRRRTRVRSCGRCCRVRLPRRCCRRQQRAQRATHSAGRLIPNTAQCTRRVAESAGGLVAQVLRDAQDAAERLDRITEDGELRGGRGLGELDVGVGEDVVLGAVAEVVEVVVEGRGGGGLEELGRDVSHNV